MSMCAPALNAEASIASVFRAGWMETVEVWTACDRERDVLVLPKHQASGHLGPERRAFAPTLSSMNYLLSNMGTPHSNNRMQ
jgi:hypothetical protein